MTSTGPRPGSRSRPTGSAASAEGPAHWFEPLADHLGPAYERYAFTRGTDQEVGFLVEHLGLGPGTRVLDLGCGTGRHARAMADRGIPVTGVDVAERFVRVAHAAGSPARFVRGDARHLPLVDGAADVVVSLCQGAFGLTGGPAAAGVPDGVEPDEVVLGEVHRVLRPGGRLALTAFSSYFSLRDLGEEETFDAEAGVLHERTELRDESGTTLAGDLWTTCYTPRELRLLLRLCGFAVERLWSVRPGRYTTGAASVASPEYLVVARRSG